jgi:beta-glucanase (GH16 family)
MKINTLLAISMLFNGAMAVAATSIESSGTSSFGSPLTPASPTRSGWKLVWSDEFDVEGLPDPTKWGYDTDRNKQGWYNNELQYYAKDRLENASVQGGFLTITTRRESLTTAADYGGQLYTSARLTTRDKPSATWTYGFMEVRAKLPCSLGTWPAIWMLGTNGIWPDDGEIDIMEQKGTSADDKTKVAATVHTKAYNHANGTVGVAPVGVRTIADACTQFHNYQLTWTTDKVMVGVDDAEYFTYAKPEYAGYAKWPFDDSQYLILNIALGGFMGGEVPKNFVSDQMVVDYVRVYQK